MKRNLIVAVILIITVGLTPQFVQAQKMYIGLEGGYGLKISPQSNGWNYTNVDHAGTITTYERVNFSLGQGLQTGASFGYMLTENIGVELGVYYFGGSPCKAHYTRIDTLSTYENVDFSFSAKMVRISPSLILTTNSGKLNPYMKFGAAINKGSLEEVYEGVDYTSDYIIRRYRYNKGLALGLTSAVGLSYAINDKFTAFGEVRMINMAYSPEKRLMTKYTVNGADQLPSMTTEDKEVDYVNSYDYDSANPPSVNEPATWLKENFSLNSIGLNLGVRFNL